MAVAAVGAVDMVVATEEEGVAMEAVAMADAELSTLTNTEANLLG